MKKKTSDWTLKKKLKEKVVAPEKTPSPPSLPLLSPPSWLCALKQGYMV